MKNVSMIYDYRTDILTPCSCDPLRPPNVAVEW